MAVVLDCVIAAGCLGPGGGELVAVKLGQVVARHQESPLGAHLGPAASVKSVGAVVVFGVAEQRLDRLLACAIEPPAVLCGEHLSHPGVASAGPPRSGGAAAALVGRNRALSVPVPRALCYAAHRVCRQLAI